MSDLAGQFERAAVGQLDVNGEPLSDLGLACGIDKTAALGEIGDARQAFSARGSVPNGLKRNFQSLFVAAFVHIQGWLGNSVAIKIERLSRIEAGPLSVDELILYHGSPCSNQN